MTVPNILTFARMIGSGVLLWLAYEGHAIAFVWLFAILLLTDWLDGKLAIILDQRSVLGARLDSIGDAVMYGVLVLGTIWLNPEFMRANAILIIAVFATYGASAVVSLIRFRRLPAYHTRAAKTCWLLISIGAITVLAGGPHWPAQVALVGAILTNVEATAMSFVLNRWHADVPSIYHAVQLARQEKSAQ